MRTAYLRRLQRRRRTQLRCRRSCPTEAGLSASPQTKLSRSQALVRNPALQCLQHDSVICCISLILIKLLSTFVLKVGYTSTTKLSMYASLCGELYKRLDAQKARNSTSVELPLYEMYCV